MLCFGIVSLAVFHRYNAQSLDAANEELKNVNEALSAEILERKNAEDRTNHFTGLLRTLQVTNQLITREQDLQTLLEATCKLLLQTKDYTMVWIGLSKAGNENLVPAACRSEDDASILGGNDLFGAPPAAMAARNGRLFLCNDISQEIIDPLWQKEALKRGIQSMVAAPMLLGERRIGALAVYSNNVNSFDPHETSIIDELAGDLAHAVYSIENEQKRRDAERSLLESEQRYRLLFKSMVAAFALHEIILDENRKPIDYRFLEVNPAFELQTGLVGKDIIGRTVLEVLPDLESTWIERYGKVALTGKSEHFESYSGPLDKYFEVEAYQLGAGRFATVFIDVTERKRTEEALRQSEENCRAVVEQAYDAIVLFDALNGKLIEANKSFCTLLGYDAEDISKLTIYDLVAHDHESVYQNIQIIITEKSHKIGERKYRRKDGSLIDLEVGASLIMRSGHAVISVVARDITERKIIEANLQKSEQEKTAILNSLKSVSIEYLDPGMRIIWSNSPAQEATGLTNEEIWGRHCYSLFYGINQPCEGCTAIKALSLGEVQEGELITPDGRIWISRSTPLKDGAQSVIGVVHAAVNITHLKLAEEKLAKKTADLVRSNADLEQFAYVASHDLQEPLRAVTSFVQLLQKRYHGRLDKDADEFIDYAVNGTKRMQQLINDLLAYSRVETRGKPFSPMEIEDILEVVLDNLKIVLEDTKGIVTHDPLPRIIADKTQMIQLFQNLIGNALKFHGAEPPRVHISAKRVEEQWHFLVQDNGIGIDPRYMDRIFVIFQRLHRVGEYPGTGIGLAIAKKIVKRHGGRIWVESCQGSGSTFCFTIPVRPEDAKEDRDS
ncbi:Methanogenesis regulatory histidine kinase FilI [uncultured archaeon]|nr:Methanogenesis regulatory histidine kinase FilI [uncultured archaeon]